MGKYLISRSTGRIAYDLTPLLTDKKTTDLVYKYIYNNPNFTGSSDQNYINISQKPLS
jgi:hypothetical protein